MVDRFIYLLDADALATYPTILAMVPPVLPPTHTLVIPTQVLEEVKERARSSALHNNLLQLLQASKAKSYLKIIDTPLTDTDAGSTASRKALLALALQKRSLHEQPIVLTADLALFQECHKYGISVTSSAFLKFLSFETLFEIDSELMKIASKILRQQRIQFARSVAVGLLSATLLAVAALNLSLIVSTISIWGTLASFILLGILLYWVRGHRRLEYAVAEFLIGILIIVNVLWPNLDLTVPISPALLQTPGPVVQLAGGLYVMVRGLDNIEKGLEYTLPSLHERWTKFFERQQASPKDSASAGQ